MRYTVVPCLQGTPAWRLARLGRLTGSAAKTLVLKRKDKAEPAGIRDLRMKLALERVTRRVEPERWMGEDVKRGIQLEPAARRAYEQRTGSWVDEVGFLSGEELLAGVSIDGYIGTLGQPGLVVVEFKCRRNANHLEVLTSGVVPEEFALQIVHTLWFLEEAERVDFVSYAPSFPAGSRLAIVPVTRASLEKEIAAYNLLARQFLASVDAQVEKLPKEAV